MLPYVHDAVADMQRARDELNAALDEVGPHDWERYVPYGARTLHDILAHVAGADQVWALAAQGLLKAEGGEQRILTAEEARAARDRAIERGRRMSVAELRGEMERRRRLLASVFGLIEKQHLALRLPSFGAHHDSVRERIWLGYHDRLHAQDVRRALASNWHPQPLAFLPELRPGVDALDCDETLYVIFSVDPVKWEEPSSLPGWSYRMLLAHIATGDWVLQTHMRHLLEHRRVAEWPDVAAGNAERLHERRFSTDRALTDEYLSMRHETLRLLARLEPAHLREPITLWWTTPPRPATVQEYVDGFHVHELTHREQLRRAMKYATSQR